MWMRELNVIESYNPATLEKVGEVEEIEPEHLAKIITRARKGQKKLEKTSVKDRTRLLEKLMDYVIDHMDEIARVIHIETGKPKLEAINSDILAGLGMVRYTIDYLKEVLKRHKIKFKGMRIPMWYMGRTSYISPKPLGIIGIISPWNFPFGIPFSQVVQAIAVGNAVILKPSSETPMTGLKIKEVLDKAGFPKDLLQVVPGSGSKIGSALVKSEVNRIIFTGSVNVGKKIMEMASQKLTPVTLELGGKSPMIVFEDADLERTVQGAVWGSFVNTGQMCAGIKRIYVQEGIYEQFLQRFKEQTEQLNQGWGWQHPEISMGPLINEGALLEMEKHVKRAKEQGAKILTGGKKHPDLKGYFFEPTIITKAKQESDVVQKEIFGPIVPVLPFKTEEEAIRMANDSEFGLYGSVWTTDLEKGKRIAEQMTMGTIAVNNHAYTYGIPHTPWGGNKNSGFGRTHGNFGFEELMEPHHIHVDEGKIEKELWWQPYDENKLEAQKDIADVLFRKKYTKIFSLLRKFKK